MLIYPAPLGTFRDDSECVALQRQRKDELGLSNAALDALAGLTDGHADRLLGPAGTKDRRRDVHAAVGCAGLVQDSVC
jgi:hypothetical protein